MFVAIVVPPCKKHLSTLIVVLVAIALSLAFKYVPVLQGVSYGFSIIICAVVASLFGATFFPLKEAADEP